MSAPDARAIVRIALALLLMTVTSQAQVLPPPGPGGIEPAPAGSGLAPEDGDDSHDVLTRGPIHEAFAEQYNADPAEGFLVTRAPPEPIDEIAPETMPEGNNIQWVSGYWGWDDERQDFIWISGLWRDIPPGQRWVPGYWSPADGGYQWVSGFWTGAESAELDYLPQAPPQSLERGPNIEAPAEDQFWVPGVWTYVETDYRWRPGYWAPAYDNWVWVPDRWVWTPYGFVFCPGYYDYRLPVRAVAFAPVYFSHVRWWYRRPFCPSVVLDCGPLTMHWFVRPNYCHYYFGDYYADTYYTGWGLQPWHTCSFGFGGYGGWRNRHCHYDPLFVFYSGYHRRHHRVDFGDRMNRWHNHYTRHSDDRPRWTKRDQDNFDDAMRKAGRVRGDGKQNRIGRDFNEFVANPSEREQKFVKLDGRQRDRQTKIAKETVQLATLRHDLETEGGRVRGVRGDGRPGGRTGNDASIALPGVNGGEGNKNGDRGNGDRGSRKLKLPNDKGAGDQAIVTTDGNREPNRQRGRIKTPDGPPGGSSAVVRNGNNDDNGTDRDKGNNRSGGNNSGRGRGQGFADGSLGQDGNNNAGRDGNSDGQRDNNRRDGRGSKGATGIDNPPGVIGGDDQNPGAAGTNNGASRGRDRNRGSNNGSQDFNPLQGNPAVGGDSGNSGGDGSKGSNRDRTPRRGNSGDGNGNNGLGSGTPKFNPQPLPGAGGNPDPRNNGNRSNDGRSRSRGESGSFDATPNGGGGSGGSTGNFGRGGDQQRRSGGNSSQGFGGGNSGSNGNSGGGGNTQRRGGNSGQEVGNGNPPPGPGIGSGGGGSRRIPGGSGGGGRSGGGGGGDKRDKKKD